MKTLLSAIYALLFFQPYTTYPRWIEIFLGIYAWTHAMVFLYCQYLIWFK